METTQKQLITYLTFQLCGQIYALEVAKVVKILEMVKLVRFPDLPSFIHGVFQDAEELVYVVDISGKLHKKRNESVVYSSIIIIESPLEGTLQIGLPVDNVLDVKTMLSTEIDLAQSEPNSGLTKYFKGQYTADDSCIFIIDVGKIFDEKETILD
jgi:purine-binding chemotaxis protein CheW